MSNTLTDAELQENDIYIKIPMSAALPTAAENLLKAYLGYQRRGCYVYKVPGYIARQIETILKAQKERVTA